MKIIPVFIVIVFSMAAVQVSNISLQVNGLNCMICGNSIFRTLKTHGFAERNEAGVRSCNFKIKFKTKSRIEFVKLKEAVDDAGLFVSRFVTSIDFISDYVTHHQLMTTGKTFRLLNYQEGLPANMKTHTLVHNECASSKESRKNSFSVFSPGVHYVTIK